MESRDVRLTERQLWYGADAIRRRIRQLDRSIAATESCRERGEPIQLGTLNRHYTARAELRDLREIFEHNHQAIGRAAAARIKEKL